MESYSLMGPKGSNLDCSEDSVITQILKYFELPELISTFRRERIDEECLRFMTESDLEKLIPQLNLRIKFRAKLSAWKRFKSEQRSALKPLPQSSSESNELKNQSTPPRSSSSQTTSSLKQSPNRSNNFKRDENVQKKISVKKSRWEPAATSCKIDNVTKVNTSDRSHPIGGQIDGHLVKNCKVAVCDFCKGTDHIARDCLRRFSNFAVRQKIHCSSDNGGSKNRGKEEFEQDDANVRHSYQNFEDNYSSNSTSDCKTNLRANFDQRRLSLRSNEWNIKGWSEANENSFKPKIHGTKVDAAVHGIDQPTLTHMVRLNKSEHKLDQRSIEVVDNNQSNASNVRQHMNFKDCSLQQPSENVKMMDVAKAQKRKYINQKYNDDEAPKSKLIKDATYDRPILKEDVIEKQRSGDNTICFRCGQLGHTTRYCSQRKKCFGCQDIGHEMRNCPNRFKQLQCYACKEIGHIARDCQNKLHGYYQPRNDSDGCFNRDALGGNEESDGSSDRRCLRYISPVNFKIVNNNTDVATSADYNKPEKDPLPYAKDSILLRSIDQAFDSFPFEETSHELPSHDVISEAGYQQPFEDPSYYNNNNNYVSTTDEFFGFPDLDAYLNYT